MKYDIIVIGAGSGGLNIAMFMNRIGCKVLLIDKSNETIGGDCLNFGCVPSKALIHCAKIIHESRQAKAFGVSASGKVDLKKVMQYIKEKQDIIREHETASYFRKLGIDMALGKAHFVSKNGVKVGSKVYHAKRIVIATGSRPRQLKLPGIEKVKIYNNENIFGLTKLPEHMVIIGGGPIGMEIGQCFLRFGSKVTVIQNKATFLPKEEPEIAQVLRDQLEKEGMKILFSSEPVEFTSSKEVVISTNGKKSKLSFDTLFVSIGRVLNKDGLNLEAAGIEHDERKIKCDQYLRTTNKNVYLCGDVAGSYQFTHAAELHAGVILNNFFSPLKKKVNYDHLSWVTYTVPEIATFGLNEQQLKGRKLRYERLVLSFDHDDRSIVDDYRGGKLIVYVVKNKILGGTMCAMNAGELFQELVLANSTKMDIKKLFSKIYPYPTASRVNKKIIANYMGKKLTEFGKKVLRFMY